MGTLLAHLLEIKSFLKAEKHFYERISHERPTLPVFPTLWLNVDISIRVKTLSR